MVLFVHGHEAEGSMVDDESLDYFDEALFDRISLEYANGDI